MYILQDREDRLFSRQIIELTEDCRKSHRLAMLRRHRFEEIGVGVLDRKQVSQQGLVFRRSVIGKHAAKLAPFHRWRILRAETLPLARYAG